MKVECEKCGKEYELEDNENPNKFQCECGGNLHPPLDGRNIYNPRGKRFIYALIIGCILFIGIVGILFIFIGSSTTADDEIASNGTWHSVTTFSGSNTTDTSPFTIQGKKFRIKITANSHGEKVKSTSVYAFVYPEGQTSQYIGKGILNDVTNQTIEETYEIKANPGSYYINVKATSFTNWKIEVFDYY